MYQKGNDLQKLFSPLLTEVRWEIYLLDMNNIPAQLSFLKRYYNKELLF